MIQEDQYTQQILDKYQITQPSVRYSNDNGDKCPSTGNFFSTFLYQDHVTKHKWEYSKLQSWKKIKTLGDQTSLENVTYSQEVNLMKVIRQNRNKKLLEGYKTKKPKLIKDDNQQYRSLEQMKKMKRKIRNQVLSLNHDFLREYLYHQQPFNQMIVQINRISNQGSVNEHKLQDLKQRIAKCIQRRKEIKKNVDKQEFQIQKKKVQLNKINKQIYEKEIDNKFENIWQQVRKDIGYKIRMEGQFNLHSSKLKCRV